MSRERKKKPCILLIEDDELNLELVQTVLEGAGFRVLTSTSAQEGIELARRKRPEAILMDLQMPELDGIEATRILRGDPETAGIPIIAVTAHVKREDAQRSLDAGCVLHLCKPVDTRTLPQTVQNVIAASRETVA
jgi:CheY-like chemotaxis protein